jgi:hypothetical protein
MGKQHDRDLLEALPAVRKPFSSDHLSPAPGPGLVGM